MADSKIPGLTTDLTIPKTIHQWRLQILNGVLYSAFALGTLAIINAVINTLQSSQIYLLLFYLAIYLILGLGAFIPKLGYVLRAAMLLCIGYCTALAGFYQSGLLSNGPLFLLGFIVLTTILFNLRYGIIALALSLATLFVFGWATTTQPGTIPFQPEIDHTSISLWIRSGLAILLLGGAISISVRYLIRHLEYELHESRSNYNFVSTILDMAGALVMVVDIHGRIIRFNRTCEQITGFTLDEVEEKIYWDIFLEAAAKDDEMREFKSIASQHILPQREITWRVKSDKRLLISWSHTALFNSSGQVKYVVAVGIDVTERRRIEQERERLLEAERKQRDFAEALRKAGMALGGTLDEDTVLDRLLAHVEQIVPFDAANIMLVKGNMARIARHKGYHAFGDEVVESASKLALNIATTENLRRMAATGEPALIPDTATEKSWINTAASKKLHSWIGAPIAVQGKVIAFFALDKTEPNYYRPEHLERLAIFASHAALAMENVRLFAAEAERRQKAEDLRRATAALTGHLRLQDVMDKILTGLNQVLSYDTACMFLRQGNVLRAVAGKNLPAEEKIIGYTLPEEDALFKTLQHTKKPVAITDAQQDPRFLKWGETNYVRGWLGVPLVAFEDLVGYISLDSTTVGAYDHIDLFAVQIFASQAAIALNNAQLFEQTQSTLSQTKMLYHTTSQLISDKYLPDLLQDVVENTAKAVSANRVTLITVDIENQSVIDFVAGGPGVNHVVIVSFNELWEGLTGWVLRELKPAFSPKGLIDTRESEAVRKRRTNTNVGSIIVVPLLYHHNILGTMTALNLPSQPDFTETDVDLMLTIANQTATTIENNRLLQETQEASWLSDTLREFGAALVESLDFSEVVERIFNYLGKVVPYNSTSVMLLKNDELCIHAARGISNDHPVWNHPISIAKEKYAHETCVKRQPVVISNVQNDPHWQTFFTDVKPIKSWIGVPLIANDKVLGILTLDHYQPNFYTTEHLTIAGTFAHQAAIALANARLFEATNRRIAELEAVRQATLNLTSSLELEPVLENILKIAVQLTTKTQNAHVFLYQNNQIQFGTAILGNSLSKRPFSKPRPGGLVDTIINSAERVVVPDMQNHPLYVDAPPDWEGAILGMPLKIAERVGGVMTISCQKPRVWSDEELRALELLADQAAIAIENTRLYNQVQQHATEMEASVAKRTFELQTLYELSHALGQASQFDDVIHLILRHLNQAIPHNIGACLLVTESLSSITIRSVRAIDPPVEAQVQHMLLETFAHLRGTPLNSETIEFQRLQPSANLLEQPAITSLGVSQKAPIVISKNLVGVLLIANQHKNETFSQEQIRLLHTMADQAAETIGRLQLLLTAEHQRLESLITHLPNGVILLDMEQRVVLINQAAKKLVSTLIQAQVGDQLTHIGRYPVDTMLASAATKTAVSEEIEEQLFNKILEVDANPVSAGPESGGWTLVIRDVTQERMIQKQVQQQERMAAVGQLAAGIAHDFNNILTSIIGFAELLSFDPGLSPQAKNDVERITRQGHRAAHLVRQILDFSRQTITEKYSLDMIPFIKETVKLLERTLPEDIHITTKIEPGQYVIKADLAQMQQVVTNLAVNSRDAMSGGGTLNFKLSKLTLANNTPPPVPDMSPGNWIVLKVSDTGTGIPPEIMEQIFEPFFTTKEVGKGTGLGLAQVYGIIKQHDSFINVDSHLNRGTIFSIYFPPFSPASPKKPKTGPLEILKGKQQLILLVEDDATVLEIGTTMLKHLNYRVVTAVNGFDALEVFRQNQDDIALVLTDITMPQMGGAELAAALQELDPNVKVVALTGYPLEDMGKEMLTQGVIDWLQKPLSLKKLAQTLHNSI